MNAGTTVGERNASEGEAARAARSVETLPGSPGGERWAWLLLALVLCAAGFVRWGLLDAPLERDEGEYAYMGQLLLRGEPPYGVAYNMKLPGIYAAYAGVLALFGETARGVHTGLLLANGLSILFLFLLGRRLLGAWAALAAATVFAALSVSEGVQGPFANAEHFVLVPALAGLWLFARALEAAGRRRLVELALAGFLLGVAFVVKQHGLAYGAFAGLFLLLRELRGPRSGHGPQAAATRRASPWPGLGRLALFGLALLLPYGLVCLWMKLAGVFENFWFWTFTYAREYTGERPWSDFLRNLRGKARYVTRVAPWLWALAGLGLCAPLWDRRTRARAAFLGLFALFSFLAITPGFHFRPHYFVLLLPAAALWAGAFLAALGRVLAGRTGRALGAGVAVACLALALGDFLRRQWVLLFELPPALVARQVFGNNPFPESPAIANVVREATTPDQKVAILGSEPQIWFYADRRGASGYVYSYALMESHPFALAMQRDMIRQLEAARAEVVVFVRVATSWLMSERSPTELQQWIGRELGSNYELIALMPVGLGARMIRGPALERLKERPKEDVVEVWRRIH